MDKTMIIVSAVVGSLGLLSAILGFSAESTKRPNGEIKQSNGMCWYPVSPALPRGVCAAIFLMMAQATVAVGGGCCGCCKSRALPSKTKPVGGRVCAVISWIAAKIAFGFFVLGAKWNSSWERPASEERLCYDLMPGIFAGASVLTLVATALGITSYVMLRVHPADAAAPKAAGAGIAMGQPREY